MKRNMLEGQPKLCGYILRGTKMIGLDENSIHDIYEYEAESVLYSNPMQGTCLQYLPVAGS